MISRRQFTKAALARPRPAGALRAARSGASPVGGVRLGVQTYSFRDIARSGTAGAADVIIDVDEDVRPRRMRAVVAADRGRARGTARRDAGRAAVEARRAARSGGSSTGRDYFEGIRRRFAAAGITIYAYNLSFNDSFTDDEIHRGFDAPKRWALK